MVLDKLVEFGSVRQVLMWLHDEHLSLPTLEHERPRAITWRPPTYRMVLSIVRSPFYAGAYAFGRRETRTRVVAGRVTRTHGHAKPMSQWTALIRDHHPGYISWEQFERNQQRLEENAHIKGTIARQAARGGRGLLGGLLRCARCGPMLHVVYDRAGYARYQCREASRTQAAPRCIDFGARRPDETVSAAILAVVQGQALQAAIEAGDLAEQHDADQHRALALELEQAHYQAALAARRYDAVDPDNRSRGRGARSTPEQRPRTGRRAGRSAAGAGSAYAVIRVHRSRDARIAGHGSPHRVGGAQQRDARQATHRAPADRRSSRMPMSPRARSCSSSTGRGAEVRIPRPKPGEHRHRTGRMPKASCAAWPVPGPITRSPRASTGCACARAPATRGRPRVSCRCANGCISWTTTGPWRSPCSRNGIRTHEVPGKRQDSNLHRGSVSRP
jgi:Recombinase/Recombinase zinc beta ribbon domain